MFQTISDLLGSKKIPPLDTVQMSALLQHLFKTRDWALRFQVAEVAYRYEHDHPNAQDIFLACTLPLAQYGAKRKAEKLFVSPSDWQIEVMYDGAVSAAIEMFRDNRPLAEMPNAFRRFLVRVLHRGMLCACFNRKENYRIRTVRDVKTVRTRKTVLSSTIERELIAKDLLDQVTNYPCLRPSLHSTLQCIAALGPDFALKEHAYTTAGDPDRCKREWHRRPILDFEAIAQSMGVEIEDVHYNLRQARTALHKIFNADGRLFLIH
jgi:hypothetical protein